MLLLLFLLLLLLFRFVVVSFPSETTRFIMFSDQELTICVVMFRVCFVVVVIVVIVDVM